MRAHYLSETNQKLFGWLVMTRDFWPSKMCGNDIRGAKQSHIQIMQTLLLPISFTLSSRSTFAVVPQKGAAQQVVRPKATQS